MIWVVGIVVALVLFKDRLPGGIGSAVDNVLGMAGTGTNAISNGQVFTQSPMSIMAAGSQVDTSGASNAAPNTAPGNVPIRPPGFAGTNFGPVSLQARLSFQGTVPQTTINPAWGNAPGGFIGKNGVLR